VEVFGAFDAFGDGPQSERVSEVDDRSDDGVVDVVVCHLVHEGGVDFDEINGEPFEVGEQGVSVASWSGDAGTLRPQLPCGRRRTVTATYTSTERGSDP